MAFLIGSFLERSLNSAVFEILYALSEAYWGHEFDLSRSRDVNGHVTIR